MIFGINTTSDISKLLYVISRTVRRVKFETILKYHEWYLCQISRTNHAIICLYYYPQKRVCSIWDLFTDSWSWQSVVSSQWCFYLSFLHWIDKMKYSCYQRSFVILGWLVYWVVAEKCAPCWTMRKALITWWVCKLHLDR